MLNIKLHDFQEAAISAIREALRSSVPRLLVQSPTGSGKTIILSSLTATTATRNNGWRCLILVPKIKLVRQISNTLSSFNQAHGIICGSLKRYDISLNVVVATYQSIAIQQNIDKYDCIIVDEAHRVNPSDDSNQRELLSRLSHQDTRIIGFTATPYRGVLPIWKIGKFWKEPVYKITIPELTTRGFLVKAKMIGGENCFSTKDLSITAGEWDQGQLSTLAKNKEKLSLQVQDALRHLDKESRKSVVWLCIDQDHAESLLEELYYYKETAVKVISRDSLDERDDSFEEFEEGRVRHLVSVQIASEGFDAPRVDAVVFLRPTRSIVTYIQAVGRALRPSLETGKEHALILDYGEVVKNCGKLDRPFVTEDGEYRRDSKALRDKLKEKSPYRTLQCESCGCFFFPLLDEEPKCEYCGHVYEPKRSAKLSDSAASGDLYSEIPQMANFIVTGVKEVQLTNMTLYITFIGIKKGGTFDGSNTTAQMEFYAPKDNSGKPSVYEMGQLRRSKSWLEKAFKVPAYFSARKMAEFIYERKMEVMPRLLVQVWGEETAKSEHDTYPEGYQPIAAQIRLEDVLQESLF